MGNNLLASRESYILNIALALSSGNDNETFSDEEYMEAVELLKRAGITIPVIVESVALVAIATA